MNPGENLKIKVLVIERSVISRLAFAEILKSDPHVRVIGAVRDGAQALTFLSFESPDVILIGSDTGEDAAGGYEASRLIMASRPIPIVICSDYPERMNAFKLMELGAVACVGKPITTSTPEFAKASAELLLTVKLMSEVKVVHRRSRGRTQTVEPAPASAISWRDPSASELKFIGIGASTGGPPVLQTILGSLPKDFSIPILIVQHIAAGFLPGMVEWLNQTTGMKIHIAGYGMEPLPGHIYLAPDEFHMAINSVGQIILNKEVPETGVRPSVAHLFRSLANHYGPASVGVLLTGMGKDGARELRLMRDRGALTIAQNRATSAVFGMPGEAVALDAATYILPTDAIAPALMALSSRQPLVGALQHEYIRNVLT